MKKIARNDVNDIASYEKIRGEFRQRIIDLKARRRVGVGPHITLVFENRDTVLFQIQEMMRVERLVHEDQIQFEIDTYNSLIPDANELSATLFVEIIEKERIKDILDSFIGLDQGETVWIEFGEQRVAAGFEQGRSNEEKISAVHFLKFRFTPQQARRFRSGEDQAFLTIRHGAYGHSAQLSTETSKSLAGDLES